MRIRRGVLLGIMTAVLTVAVTAQTDVTGDWNLTFNLDTGATFATMTVVSIVVGMSSVGVGLLISYHADLPSGATIILTQAAVLFGAMIARRQPG